MSYSTQESQEIIPAGLEEGPDEQKAAEAHAITVTEVVFAAAVIGALMWIWAVFFFVL